MYLQDYGTLSCWASNEVGTQQHPCLFQVVLAGKFSRGDWEKCPLRQWFTSSGYTTTLFKKSYSRTEWIQLVWIFFVFIIFNKCVPYKKCKFQTFWIYKHLQMYLREFPNKYICKYKMKVNSSPSFKKKWKQKNFLKSLSLSCVLG